MPTLTIGDRSVEVGDSFLKLSPEQQNATVEEIARSVGAGITSGNTTHSTSPVTDPALLAQLNGPPSEPAPQGVAKPAISVTAPSGATVDFPEGTNHATINGVMMKHFGPDAPAQLGPAAAKNTFEVTAPDAKIYGVEGANAEGALAALQKHSKVSSTINANPFEEYRPRPENPFAEYAPTAEQGRKVTDPALLAQLDGPPSVAMDVAKSGGIGLVKGGLGLVGALGDLSDMGAKGIEHASNYVSDKLGIPRYERPTTPSILNNIPTADSLQKNVEGVTGEFYKPKTKMGEYAQTVGEFVPALVGGPESVAAKVATRVAVPAAVSETAGQLTKGTAAEPYARFAGAVLSPLTTSGLRRAITPIPASAERTALAETLTHEGVEMTAGQRTGSKPLQWAESTLGDMPGSGGRAAATQENQAQQFTAAALRRAGETADRATPDVIDGAFRRIGNDFDGVALRNRVMADRHLGNDLATVEGEYNALVGPSQRAPVVANTIRDVGDIVAQNGGHITGEQFNAMSSRLARQARGAKADPQLQEALSGTRAALDDAMERSLHASGNTADLETFRDARRQYRNLLVVEKAATGAGAATAEGLISPSQLRNATVNQNRRNYARGQGDFADLARSGEALLKPLPNSGTAPRQHMQHLMSIVGGAAGGATGGLPGAMAGIAAPAVAGRVLMSRPVQAYFGNQVLGPATESRSVNAVTAALLASQGSREPTPSKTSPAVAKVVKGLRP